MSFKNPVILFSLLCFLFASGCATSTGQKADVPEKAGNASEKAEEAPAKVEEGSEEAKESRPQVEILMEASGLNKQIEQFPFHVQQGFAQAKKADRNKTTDIDYDGVEKILMESLAPEGLKAGISKRLAEKLSEEEITEILTWLNSRIGKSITYLEEKASTPAAQNRMRALSKSLLDSGKKSGRTELVQKLDQAAGITEGSVDMMLNAELAISLALAGATVPADDALFDNIMKNVRMKRPMVKEVLEKQVMLNLLYTYQMLKNSELKEYITFAESTTGQKYHETIMKAMTELITEAGKNTGRRMGDLLKEKKE